MIVSRAEAQRRLNMPLPTLGGGRRTYYILNRTGRKKLGGPYTKLGAERRLRQIEYFKHRR